MERKRLKSKKEKKANLADMTPKELKKLRAKINFLIDNTEDLDDYSYAIFYDLLTNKLNGILRSSYTPFPVFKKTKTYKKLVDVVDFLDGLLESMFAKPKKLWYRKMYRLYISLVICDIQGSPLPLEVPIILNFQKRFPAILDNAFPGYLENGLFSVVFKGSLPD